MKSPSSVLRIAGLAIAVALLLGPPAASAAPVVNGEFPVNGVGTNNEITLGPDGNMWVTLDAVNDVAKITPEGVVTEYQSANITNPVGITADPDGNMWVTQNGGVARFSTADPTTATPFAIAAINSPQAITVGADGNLWTASSGNVLRIPPANPAGFTPFAVVTSARGITAGSDGNLWVADFGAPPQIVSVTTAGTVAGTYAVTGGPQGIAAGPSNQIAYSDQAANPHEIGRITAGGTAQITQTPAKDPFGVAFGSDGAYWFANFTGDDLGRLTTDGTYTTLPGFTAGSGPRRIAAGPGNTLWVTLDTTNKIARVTGVDPPVVDPPVVDPPPPTDAPVATIGKKPAKRVETSKSRAKVKFGFSSSIVGATFECALAKLGKSKQPERAEGFKACESPQKYKLKPGRYSFSVRASAGGLTGPVASAKFKVVEKKD